MKMKRIVLNTALLAAVIPTALAVDSNAQAPSPKGPPRHAAGPRVSPDGKQILFAMDSGGQPQRYVMNADGTNQRRLPDATLVSTNWFPDGKRLLTIQRADRSSPPHLMIMNVDGTESHEIPVEGVAVSGMPLGDGSSILVIASQSGADPRTAVLILRVMHLDGSVVRTITLPTLPGPVRAMMPSRDGQRLAFVALIRDTTDVSPYATKSSTLYTMNIEGSDLKTVATFTGTVEQPSWSHDDRKIALQHDHPYAHDATGKPLDPDNLDSDIVVVDVASGAVRDLKHPDRKYLDETPDWSPDGRLYIQSTRDGAMDIYRIKADGSKPQRLTK